MWKILFAWFLSVLPDSILQSLVLIRFICFLVLLWQQVVIVCRLRTDYVVENRTFLTCQHLTWLAVLCLLNGKVVVWVFFKCMLRSFSLPVTICFVAVLIHFALLVLARTGATSHKGIMDLDFQMTN